MDHRAVRSALEPATRAPSIHDSRPWRWLPLTPRRAVDDAIDRLPR